MYFVLKDPSIVIQPENVPTVHGGSITLTCGAVSSATSFSIKWTQNGSDIRDDGAVSLTNTTWHNVKIFKLNIKGVAHRHTGKYRCIVTNAKGTVRSRRARVFFSSK